jgi:hypothetical protein
MAGRPWREYKPTEASSGGKGSTLPERAVASVLVRRVLDLGARACERVTRR